MEKEEVKEIVNFVIERKLSDQWFANFAAVLKNGNFEEGKDVMELFWNACANESLNFYWEKEHIPNIKLIRQQAKDNC